MIRLRIAMGLVAAVLITTAAGAAETPYSNPDYTRPQYWSVAIYVGPASPKYFGAILQDFNLQSHEYMVGVALDRKLVRLWREFYLSGEVQVTQYFNGHANNTFAAMLGFEIDNLFGYERTSFSFYDGPSYSLDPPFLTIGYKHRTYVSARKKFLNAIAIEFASGLPFTRNWDWTARVYHRSGVFGLYSDGCDDGMTIGLGVKYHF
jgi:hypothetical protein